MCWMRLVKAGPSAGNDAIDMLNIRKDEDGQVRIAFYTADLSATYSVILEGVSRVGEPVFQ